MPQVLIEPFDQSVKNSIDKINQIDPLLLKSITKIIVHSGGGSGQLGHVEMGPGKIPTEIHIFKDRIKNYVLTNANVSSKQKLTSQELEKATTDALMETIAHESGHISGWKRTPEQIQKGPFFGESEAEQTAKALMSKVKAGEEFPLSKRAAKYQGKEVPLNKPIRNPSSSKKKFRVYVLKDGKVKKIEFGDPKMEIKRDDPDRRKSFRARHKCDTQEGKDKTTPRYWSCYQWRQGKKVKAKQNFPLSKRANIQMACPHCRENVSNLTPEKTPAGLYKMLTCPHCKNGFYPQDALLAVKEQAPGKAEWNLPEKGWWLIFLGPMPLGFTNNSSNANLIKERIIKTFIEEGIEGLKELNDTYYHFKYAIEERATDMIAGPSPEIIPYKPYEDQKQLSEYSKRYSDGREEVEKDLHSLLTGNGDFQKKKREKLIRDLIIINKTPQNYTPPRESVITGGMPTEENYDNAIDEVLAEPELTKTRKENKNISNGKIDEFVRPYADSAKKRLKAKEQGLKPDKMCDDKIAGKNFPLSKRARTPDAVKASKKKVDEFILEAVLASEDLREKNNIDEYIEPDLKFATYIANNNQKKIAEYKTQLIKNSSLLIPTIKEAREYNNSILSKFSNINLYNSISNLINDYNNNDLVIALSQFQDLNNLEITGKLDENTIKKLTSSLNTKALPNNFGVVIPGKVYRGGMIMDESQMKALKDLGIQRVISLHSNPDIARLCNEFNMKYVPAFLENGNKEDLGRKVFGNSVAKFLLESPSYIHCYFGENRTGGVIARLRIEMGWPCEMAYKEAKAYGLSDAFVDLIDWFQEPCKEKVVDTNKIRKTITKEPYQNPEVIEQDCLTPTPNDVPYPSGVGSGPQSYSYNDYITSTNPTSIGTIPLSVKSSLKNAYEVNNGEKEAEKNEEIEETDEIVNINGLEESTQHANMNQGIALEPFWDIETRE